VLALPNMGMIPPSKAEVTGYVLVVAGRHRPNLALVDVAMREGHPTMQQTVFSRPK
jgi:hypothetical protein